MEKAVLVPAVAGLVLLVVAGMSFSNYADLNKELAAFDAMNEANPRSMRLTKMMFGGVIEEAQQERTMSLVAGIVTLAGAGVFGFVAMRRRKKSESSSA